MYELTVVIPVLNERGNIDPLLERLDVALGKTQWEAIFVDDDSTDGTTAHLRRLAQSRPNVRVFQRIGRRGLSSACVEGMLASSSPFLAVIDADLQHDETRLPEMLATLKAENLDVVVGSRFVAGADIGDFTRNRQHLSRLAGWSSRLLVHADLKDPMSGFFVLRRPFLDATVHRLSGVGFKILLDLFASAEREVKFREIPYRFGSRIHGSSKLDVGVSLDYLTLVADKLFGHVVPVRFLIFVLVGSFGVIVHLTALAVAIRVLGYGFVPGQIAAALIAMTSNFFLNNRITYHDRRLRGRSLWLGLLSFYVACAIGAFANFLVADFLYDHGIIWPVAGALGAAIGAVWNYGVTSTFTWRDLNRRPLRESEHERLPR